MLPGPTPWTYNGGYGKGYTGDLSPAGYIAPIFNVATMLWALWSSSQTPWLVVAPVGGFTVSLGVHINTVETYLTMTKVFFF